MNISQKMQASFHTAVNNPENILPDGAINWNFVDADCYMAMQPVDGEAHYNQFGFLADQFLKDQGGQICS